jgi:hypothetical protein
VRLRFPPSIRDPSVPFAPVFDCPFLCCPPPGALALAFTLCAGFSRGSNAPMLHVLECVLTPQASLGALKTMSSGTTHHWKRGRTTTFGCAACLPAFLCSAFDTTKSRWCGTWRQR